MPKKRGKEKISNYQLSTTHDKRQVAASQTTKSKRVAVNVLSGLEENNKKNTILARSGDDGGPQFGPEKDEQKKRLIMWLGVGGVMVVFFVAWIFNLKYEFKASLKKSASGGFNWSQTKSELDKAMTQVKQGLSEVKKIQENLKSKATAGETKLTAEQINLLKGKLLNEVATGTASSTKINVK